MTDPLKAARWWKLHTLLRRAHESASSLQKQAKFVQQELEEPDFKPSARDVYIMKSMMGDVREALDRAQAKIEELAA